MMPRKPCSIIALVAAVLATAAEADEPGRWFGESNDTGGYTAVFEYSPDGESVAFRAGCEEPGGPVEVWYHIERESVPGQKVDGNGMRELVEPIAVTLIVDDQRFTYDQARAQPEEMYGGNEIMWSANSGDPLFAALKSGHRLSLEIDGEEIEPLTLKGSARPFTRLLAACRR